MLRKAARRINVCGQRLDAAGTARARRAGPPQGQSPARGAPDPAPRSGAVDSVRPDSAVHDWCARLAWANGSGRRLADCLTACLDGSPRVWLVHVWSRMIPWSHVSIDSRNGGRS